MRGRRLDRQRAQRRGPPRPVGVVVGLGEAGRRGDLGDDPVATACGARRPAACTTWWSAAAPPGAASWPGRPRRGRAARARTGGPPAPGGHRAGPSSSDLQVLLGCSRAAGRPARPPPTPACSSAVPQRLGERVVRGGEHLPAAVVRAAAGGAGRARLVQVDREGPDPRRGPGDRRPVGGHRPRGRYAAELVERLRRSPRRWRWRSW